MGTPPHLPPYARPPPAEETDLRTYIIRRLLLLIPNLFIVTSMVFLFIRLISVPSFWTATIVMVYPAIWWGSA